METLKRARSSQRNHLDLYSEPELPPSKQAKKKAQANSGMSLEQRKARDAEIMRLKQEKKLEEAAAKAAASKK